MVLSIKLKAFKIDVMDKFSSKEVDINTVVENKVAVTKSTTVEASADEPKETNSPRDKVSASVKNIKYSMHKILEVPNNVKDIELTTQPG